MNTDLGTARTVWAARKAGVSTMGAAALALSLGAAAAVRAQEALPLSCEGEIAQGGLALCRTAPGAAIEIGGEKAARADADGWATLGFARDVSLHLVLQAVDDAGGKSAPLDLAVADRTFEETDVAGLDCKYVAPPPTPEVQELIARSTRAKNKAWATYAEGRGARDGFVKPGEGIMTSPYGSKRTKHGEGCSTVAVHWGQDQRAAVGSPVRAPAGGTVVLADNLYFEGGAVILDHGHGLDSIFMHMSKIEVKPGDHVAPGDLLGLAGMTGSANGPHIHWGLRWRNVFDPAGVKGAFYVDPALALKLGGVVQASADGAE